MQNVRVEMVEETANGIVVIMFRNGKQFNYFKDWNGKQELWLEADGETKLYSSLRLMQYARKAIDGEYTLDREPNLH